MALFHNLLLRGLNTIYLQAPFIKDIDKKDFLCYVYRWYDAMNGALDNTLFSKSHWGRKGVLHMD